MNLDRREEMEMCVDLTEMIKVKTLWVTFERLIGMSEER